MRHLSSMLFAALLLIPTLAISQDAKPDPWAPVRFMAGEWQGKASGQPGEGTVTRKYEFVLGNKFLHEKNVSTYAPTEKKKGEVHEHWSFISYDRARKALVLRQFHVESFVNQYVYSAEKSTASKLVFESESFENLSSQWKARETYDIVGPDEFIETFELAQGDKPFSVYSRNHFKRVKS